MKKGRIVGTTDFFGRDRLQTINDLPSETVQSDAHLADISNILARYGQTGMEQLDETALMFRDVSDFTDLADAMNQARQAEVEFLKLPSKVREIFQHDVAVWLDTAHDKEKRDALVEAGFIKPKETQSTKRRGRRKGEEHNTPIPAGEGEVKTAPPLRENLRKDERPEGPQTVT